MKRILPLLLLILAPVLAGAAGFAGARLLRPAPPAQTAAKPVPPASVAIGKFAVQIYRPRRIDTLVTEVNVSIAGAEAAAVESPLGKARLRDRAYQVLLDAAETPLYHAPKVSTEDVAQTLAAGLGPAAPGLRDVSVVYAVTMDAPRI